MVHTVWVETLHVAAATVCSKQQLRERVDDIWSSGCLELLRRCREIRARALVNFLPEIGKGFAELRASRYINSCARYFASEGLGSSRKKDSCRERSFVVGGALLSAKAEKSEAEHETTNRTIVTPADRTTPYLRKGAHS